MSTDSKQQSDNLLNLVDLQVQYLAGMEKVDAVRNISFQIRRGETLALAGESGSGKSTIGLAIMGLLKLKGGFIRTGRIEFYFQDKTVDMAAAPQTVIQKIRRDELAMILQDPRSSFNPIFTVGSQLAEALRIGGVRTGQKRQALELFKQVRLKDGERIYRSFPHELSGGQIQRAMIAMAIAKKASLLIADEATSALDSHIQMEVVNLLRRLQKEMNWAVLFITHDLGLVGELADRVLILKNGEQVESGIPSRLRQHSQNPYTRLLFDCNVVLGEKRKRLPEIVSVGQAMEKIQFKPVEKEAKGKQDHPKYSETAKNEIVLKVDKLSKVFRKPGGLLGQGSLSVNALKSVSLELRKGEILGIVGESGSGKSTLARLILYLMQPSSGEVKFYSRNIFGMDKKELSSFRKKVQIVFQNPYSSFNPKMRVGAAIEQGLRVRENGYDRIGRREKVMQLLETVGLGADHYERLPGKLSGGQLQRASLARALAVGPEIIVCDEPVSSIDVTTQARILNLLQDLREQFGLSYIFISHDLPVVNHMSDRIVVMKGGSIVDMGTFDQLSGESAHPYTRLLLDSVPGFQKNPE